MAQVTLTPDQQTKLDQFEKDAMDARSAESQSRQNDADLIALQATTDHAKQVALDDHAKALSSAQAFIDAMLGTTPPTTGMARP